MDHRRFLKHFLPEQNRLKAILLAATGDVHAMEDLHQEVSAVLWEKFDQYDESYAFGAWMTGVARLEVLKWRQRCARDRLVLSEEAVAALAETAVGIEGGGDERVLCLRRCIRDLPDHCQEVLHLRYEECLSIKAIAGRLNRSIGGVHMLLQRTREALRLAVARKEGVHREG